MAEGPGVAAPVKRHVTPETWMALGVFAIAAACYANTIHGEFVYDDIKLIVNNDIVKDPSRIKELVTTNLWGLLGRGSNYYRPLPPLVFMLLHALFGAKPEPFHLLNIVLHAGTSVLVFFTARAVLALSGHEGIRTQWASFAAALVFAVHPVHTEAVAWISGVMDLSCTLFSLTAIYLYIRNTQRDRRVWREWLSLVALLLALFSKEPAAAVPLVFIGYDLLFVPDRPSGIAAAVRRWGPAFAVFAAYLVLRSFALGGVAPFEHQDQSSLAEAFLTLPRLFALYVEKLVLPVGLNVVHDLDPVRSIVSVTFVFALVVIVAFARVSWVAVRATRAAAFGLLILLLGLAPSLYIPALSQDLSRAFAERYLYFPSVGAAMMLAAGISQFSARSRQADRASWIAISTVVVLFSAMTLSRNVVWANGLSLWSDCVAKSPGVAAAHENLGLALVRDGRFNEGKLEMQRALSLQPDLPRRTIEVGVLAARKGLMLTAILSFQTAILYQPDLVDAHYNLALAFEQLGWTAAAVQEYRNTLALSGSHADAHNNVGILLAQQNSVDDAIEHFEAAIRSRPDDPELHLNLARAYDMKGRKSEADAQRALARSPKAKS